MKVGIPRALLYYRYKDLWINFFKMIDIEVIVSPNTNKTILNDGLRLSVDEACLSSKIFVGHVNYLIDKCDYILVPRICSYSKNEEVCTKFNALYDICKTIFDKKFIDYNIDSTNNTKEILEFINMGNKLGVSKIRCLNAYRFAKKKFNEINKSKLDEQNNILKKNNTKILIVSHPYNTHDKEIGFEILQLFKEMNIDIIYADIIDNKDKNLYKYISTDLYWKYNKELLAGIVKYKDLVDGIIILTTFPCGTDSLVNDLIVRKIKGIPICTIIIDELNSKTGLQTRIESFVDILTYKKIKTEVKVNE